MTVEGNVAVFTTTGILEQPPKSPFVKGDFQERALETA